MTRATAGTSWDVSWVARLDGVVEHDAVVVVGDLGFVPEIHGFAEARQSTDHLQTKHDGLEPFRNKDIEVIVPFSTANPRIKGRLFRSK